MIKKYKHISFDLDGTLVHTLPEYFFNSLVKTIKKLNGVVPDDKTISRLWFESGRDELIGNELGLNPGKFWERFRQIDTPGQRCQYTKPYSDVEMCLKNIKNIGKRISIITGGIRNIAEAEVKMLNSVALDYFFPIDYSRFKEKPAPESFLFVLSELKVKPEETVYIGNSSEDARFAENAGVDFIYLERKQHEFDSDDWMTNKIHSLDELFQ